MPSSSRAAVSKPWQDRLSQFCAEWELPAPTFHIVSDRRGGRTAWSSRVTVNGTLHQARFWYDGNNLNNAKEDAAEVALNWLNQASQASGW